VVTSTPTDLAFFSSHLSPLHTNQLSALCSLAMPSLRPYKLSMSEHSQTSSTNSHQPRTPITITEPSHQHHSFAPFPPSQEPALHLLAIFLVLAYLNVVCWLAGTSLCLATLSSTPQHTAHTDTQALEAMAVSGLLASESFFTFFLFFC